MSTYFTSRKTHCYLFHQRFATGKFSYLSLRLLIWTCLVHLRVTIKSSELPLSNAVIRKRSVLFRLMEE